MTADADERSDYDLIVIKPTSGTSTPHRLCDLVDVQDLIGLLRLSRDFGGRLDTSVRESFYKWWRLAQADRRAKG